MSGQTSAASCEEEEQQKSLAATVEAVGGNTHGPASLDNQGGQEAAPRSKRLERPHQTISSRPPAPIQKSATLSSSAGERPASVVELPRRQQDFPGSPDVNWPSQAETGPSTSTTSSEKKKTKKKKQTKTTITTATSSKTINKDELVSGPSQSGWFDAVTYEQRSGAQEDELELAVSLPASGLEGECEQQRELRFHLRASRTRVHPEHRNLGPEQLFAVELLPDYSNQQASQPAADRVQLEALENQRQQQTLEADPAGADDFCPCHWSKFVIRLRCLGGAGNRNAFSLELLASGTGEDPENSPHSAGKSDEGAPRLRGANRGSASQNEREGKSDSRSDTNDDFGDDDKRLFAENHPPPAGASGSVAPEEQMLAPSARQSAGKETRRALEVRLKFSHLRRSLSTHKGVRDAACSVRAKKEPDGDGDDTGSGARPTSEAANYERLQRKLRVQLAESATTTGLKCDSLRHKQQLAGAVCLGHAQLMQMREESQRTRRQQLQERSWRRQPRTRLHPSSRLTIEGAGSSRREQNEQHHCDGCCPANMGESCSSLISNSPPAAHCRFCRPRAGSGNLGGHEKGTPRHIPTSSSHNFACKSLSPSGRSSRGPDQSRGSLAGALDAAGISARSGSSSRLSSASSRTNCPSLSSAETSALSASSYLRAEAAATCSSASSQLWSSSTTTASSSSSVSHSDCSSSAGSASARRSVYSSIKCTSDSSDSSASAASLASSSDPSDCSALRHESARLLMGRRGAGRLHEWRRRRNDVGGERGAPPRDGNERASSSVVIVGLIDGGQLESQVAVGETNAREPPPRVVAFAGNEQPSQPMEESTARPTKPKLECGNRTDRLAPAPPSRNLLSPMDFVFDRAEGGAASSGNRAHSFTAASMSSDTSNLVAQLAASARSRSLCTEDRAELARHMQQNTGQAGFVGGMFGATFGRKVEHLTRRMSRITRHAIGRLRILSTSSLAVDPESSLAGGRPSSGLASLVAESNAGQPNNRLWRGRFSSQRAMSGKSRAKRGGELEIKTHKLNRSALVLNTAQDEQDGLLYAPGGVYVGPGGVWRRQEALEWSASGKIDANNRRKSATTSLNLKPRRLSSATSWFAGKTGGSTGARQPGALANLNASTQAQTRDQRQAPLICVANEHESTLVPDMPSRTISRPSELDLRAARIQKTEPARSGDDSGDESPWRPARDRRNHSIGATPERIDHSELEQALQEDGRAQSGRVTNNEDESRFKRCTDFLERKHSLSVSDLTDAEDAVSRQLELIGGSTDLAAQETRLTGQEAHWMAALLTSGKRRESSNSTHQQQLMSTKSVAPTPRHNSNWLLNHFTQRLKSSPRSGKQPQQQPGGVTLKQHARRSSSNQSTGSPAASLCRPGPSAGAAGVASQSYPLSASARSNSLCTGLQSVQACLSSPARDCQKLDAAGAFNKQRCLQRPIKSALPSTKANKKSGTKARGPLSRSTLELNLASSCQQVVAETSFFLTQLNDRFSLSTHELQRCSTTGGEAHPSSSLWFRRASRQQTGDVWLAGVKQWPPGGVGQAADRNGVFHPGAANHLSQSERPHKALGPDERGLGAKQNYRQTGGRYEVEEESGLARAERGREQRSVGGAKGQGAGDSGSLVQFYGANLGAACIHCQLIAELTNHPESAYLSQLVPADCQQVASENSQRDRQRNEGGPPICQKPSLILTSCSGQGTPEDECRHERGHDDAPRARKSTVGEIERDEAELEEPEEPEESVEQETTTASDTSSSAVLLDAEGESFGGAERYYDNYRAPSEIRARHAPAAETVECPTNQTAAGELDPASASTASEVDENENDESRGSPRKSASGRSSERARARARAASTTIVVVVDERGGSRELVSSGRLRRRRPRSASSSSWLLSGSSNLEAMRNIENNSRRSSSDSLASSAESFFVTSSRTDRLNSSSSVDSISSATSLASQTDYTLLQQQHSAAVSEVDEPHAPGSSCSQACRHSRHERRRSQPRHSDSERARMEIELGIAARVESKRSTLEVPSQSKARSNSLDATPGATSFLRVPGNEAGFQQQQQLQQMNSQDQLSGADVDEISSVGLLEPVAQKSNRSRSVDIALPARPGDPYEVHGCLAANVSCRRDSSANSSTVQLTQESTATVAGALSPSFQPPLKQKAAASSGSSKRSRQTKQIEQRRGLESGSASIFDSSAATVIELISGREWQFEDARKKFIQGEIRVPCGNGETRALKLFVNWDENCVNGEHLWVYLGSSSEACYVGESECLKHGPRLCCSACKITAHTGCVGILVEKIKFICKHTFKDLSITNPRHLKEIQQQNVIYHHWVHKRTHCGRCKQCTKSIGNTKLPFSSKEIQAITCSWCKVSYHNKENCYTLSTLTEPCTLGANRESIIPPSWIVKLPAQTNASSDGQAQQQSMESCDQQSQQQATDIMMNQTTINPRPIRNVNELDKENEPYSHMAQAPQQQKFGSNTTITTQTSGYMSADVSNSHFLMSNRQDKVSYSISPTSETLAISQAHNELLIDPSALNAADLSLINQAQRSKASIDSAITGSRQSVIPNKDGLNQACSKNLFLSDHTKTTSDYENNMHSMQQPVQQHHATQQSNKQVRNTIYKNFNVVPQPVPGIPNAGTKPVLVFVNPRSGGNQGTKMMQKFNWLLNPRQVFDLIQCGGPREALELYRNVPNLVILTIGGDGTASWILSHLDDAGLSNRIPVAVLPLGTGNDLSRALGWGGGYADESIAKLLAQVRDGEIVQLDRWNLHVESNHEVTPSSPSEFSSAGSGANVEAYNSLMTGGETLTLSQSMMSSQANSPSHCENNSVAMSIFEQQQQLQQNFNCDTNTNTPQTPVGNNGIAVIGADEAGSDKLPMDVINNYFSFGVDAHIALEFHTAREAHPERFNSRLRNKMFYGQAGGKDLLKRKWKDLSNFVTLYCDGQDMTSRLKELKVHSVLFLNIPSYGGGTRPWPTTTAAATSFARPRTDDGLIEVIGLTTYQLPLLQAGGHGTCIAQCRHAKIITSKTIPMQVDGEPCKLLPSIITISLKNRVCMLSKSKGCHSQKV